jgi:hypothetical protein
VHATNKDEYYIKKDTFYEEVEQVFDHLPRYHMEIFLGESNAEVWREDIF